MSKRKEQTQEPITYEELKKQLKKEELIEKYRLNGYLSDYIDKPLILTKIEFPSESGIILQCYEKDSEKELRLYTNSKIVIKETDRLMKGIKMFGSILIIPKLKTSKNGKQYLTL
jgi:hypothetical protein